MIDAVLRAVARRLPRRLVYWVGIRVLAEATVGPTGSRHDRR